MRILFISDIGDWNHFENVLNEEDPDVLFIGGDVFQNAKNAVNEELERVLFETIPHDSVKKALRRRWDFLINLSIVRFYSVLQYAARRCRVFVVRGDHDFVYATPSTTTRDLFGHSPYDARKINAIENCREISGKIERIDGLRLLGLGYLESHYLKTLRSLAANQETSPDIVLAHSENRRRRIICELFKPKLFVTGHSGFGKRKMDNVWVVGSGSFPANYATITIRSDTIKSVILKRFCDYRKQYLNSENFYCAEKESRYSRWACRLCRGTPGNIQFQNSTLLELADRLEHAFPTMIELCHNHHVFIRIMKKVIVTESGVVKGNGLVADKVQKIYEQFIRDLLKGDLTRRRS